ncbi:phosphoesterase RecJ-like protein [Weissella uvarum]|uniref:DHH family phosphoesterase n=1 Tax=Weissella uvarum TaxID=1479233 RepID=UPI0019602EC0|nr:bifunctional oligoribonuclease/PAP phosphatase NrnA [Weissella uvarum]MBM7618136.1 phosphoesterase RecJ-like protein [Weissella uvarum]MCM0595122.1 bifunctional oligoribonuclease/PAP phosphatase NrnA [Weissella uvarum]
MTAQTQILAQIKQADTIIIHRHQRPDPDAIGSQMGLAELIRTSFPEKTVYTVGKQAPSMAWMGEMDQISDDVFQRALVIVTDTANEPRVDDQRYIEGRTLVKIDHHPNDEPYGDYSWVDTTVSSSSELIYDFYQEFSDELTLSDAGAADLYAGIVGDTGRFLYASDTATMAAVSGLMKFDFDWNKINQSMDTISPEAAKVSGYVYEHMTLTDSGFNYIILTNEILDSFDLGDFGTSFIVPLMGKINVAKAWAVFEQQDEGFYRVRLRARNIPINGIAKRHGGGGHPLASGAIAQNDEEVQEIIKEADQLLKEHANG